MEKKNETLVINYMHTMTQTSTSELEPTFSEVLFIWLYFTLLLGGAFYFLGSIFLPFSESPINDTEVIIFRFMFLIIAPIFTSIIFVLLLPFQKIDFSIHALLISFLHKLFFIFMIPLIYVGFLLIDYYLKVVPTLYLSPFRSYFVYLLVYILIVPWLYLTLLLYELVFGKNSSQFLKMRRLNSKKHRFLQENSNHTYQPKKLVFREKVNDHVPISGQWFAVTMNIIFIGFCTATILLPIYGNFIFGFILFLSVDLSTLCLSLNFYKYFFLKKGFTFIRLANLYHSIFGLKDISINTALNGMLINFFNFAFFISFYGLTVGNIYYNLLFLIYYVIIILILLGTIWFNQVKKIFSYLF